MLARTTKLFRRNAGDEGRAAMTAIAGPSLPFPRVRSRRISLTRWIVPMARHSVAAALTLVLALGAACAQTGDRAEVSAPPGSDVAFDVYRVGYRYIRDRYVRAVTVREVALSGLKGLSSLDS